MGFSATGAVFRALATPPVSFQATNLYTAIREAVEIYSFSDFLQLSSGEPSCQRSFASRNG